MYNMKNKKIMAFRLPEQIRREIERAVEEGIYRDYTEVVTDALRQFFNLKVNSNIKSKRVKK